MLAIQLRIAEKKANRVRDSERLEAGDVSAQDLQRENSIFPEGYFQNAKIANYADVFGR